jgi:hypothetical protein
MTRIVPVLLGSGLIAGAYLFASPWLFVAGLSGLLPSLLWVALRRRSAGLVVLLAIMLAIGLAGTLVLPPESTSDSLILGLPRRAALLMYGVGLLPGLVLGILFALKFDKMVLTRERLAELRAKLKGG